MNHKRRQHHSKKQKYIGKEQPCKHCDVASDILYENPDSESVKESDFLIQFKGMLLMFFAQISSKKLKGWKRQLFPENYKCDKHHDKNRYNRGLDKSFRTPYCHIGRKRITAIIQVCTKALKVGIAKYISYKG